MRLAAYRAPFRPHVEEERVTAIRRVTERDLALGDQRFAAKMEALTGVRLRPGAMGRPPAAHDGPPEGLL